MSQDKRFVLDDASSFLYLQTSLVGRDFYLCCVEYNIDGIEATEPSQGNNRIGSTAGIYDYF